MSDITIIPKRAPRLTKVKMSCDVPIKRPKSINVDMLHRLNCASTLMLLSGPGSGKTTWVLQFLSSEDLFRECFHRIFIICPPSSRASWSGKNNPLEDLAPERYYDEPSLENLQDIEEQIREVAEKNADRTPSKKLYCCCVLDDVQDHLKLKDVQRVLKRWAANRRHLYLFMVLVCQNYLSVPKASRHMINNVIFWNVSKEQLEDLRREYFTRDEKTFYKLINKIFVPSSPKSWIMLTRDGEIFSDWNQVLLPGEEETSTSIEKKI